MAMLRTGLSICMARGSVVPFEAVSDKDTYSRFLNLAMKCIIGYLTPLLV